MSELLRRYGHGLSGLFVALTAFWLLILVILPDLYLFENSFRQFLPAADVGSGCRAIDSRIVSGRPQEPWRWWSRGTAIRRR